MSLHGESIPTRFISQPEHRPWVRRPSRIVVERAAGTDQFQLVIGFAAFQRNVEIGAPRVLVLVRDLPSDPELQLIEHDGLTPIEEARALLWVMERYGESQRELSNRVVMSQPQISRRLALLELPQRWQRDIEREILTEETALAAFRKKSRVRRHRGRSPLYR